MRSLYSVVVLASASVMSSAIAADPKAASMQQYATAITAVRCANAMQLQQPMTAGASAQYVEDNSRLHFCQYIREVNADPTCTVGLDCPTYSSWSNANPEFHAGLPRPDFLTELEMRQLRFAAMRSAATQQKESRK